MSANQPHQTIRLSLRSIIVFILLVVVIAAIGGWFGSTIFGPRLAPLTNEQEQFITTVQEVTISPNQSKAQLVDRFQRSLLLLGEINSGTIAQASVGTVLTNDGLVVAARDVSSETLSAFDSSGTRLPLNKVGADQLYGLTYYRLDQSVIPPFELSPNNPSVGTELLGIDRSADTLAPRAAAWQLKEYFLPPAGTTPGRQQMIRLVSTTSGMLPGTPLLDEEGRVAAIIDDPIAASAIPVSDIRVSLDRVTTGQREADPFARMGLRLAYQFRFDESQSQKRFSAVIAGVTPESPAAIAGLRAGDVITKIKDDEVTSTSNIAQQLSASPPLTITIARQGQESQVTLTQ